MAQHPRYTHFPWQADYSGQANIYSPYAVSVAQPNYRSNSLNIDSFGFRYQYDLKGNRIDIKNACPEYSACTVLLGNSTAFGVSLSEDRNSLGHFLGKEGSPCINLAVRGATMQQELAVYLSHKHLLPPHKKITILTGVCDVSLAIQPEDFWLGETGGMHAVETFYKQHYQRAELSGATNAKAKAAFMDWAEDRYHRNRWLQRLFERRFKMGEVATPLTENAISCNLDKIFPSIENVIQTWGWIKKSTNIEIQIILQPVLGWTAKPLSAVERECVDADIERIPAMHLYANTLIYERVRGLFEQSCTKNQLTFTDVNYSFGQLKSSKTHFTDICHLTDLGTKQLAEWLMHDDIIYT